MVALVAQIVRKYTGDRMLASVATGAGSALIIRIGGTGIAYLSHMLFARWLGAAEYGSYIYAITWAKLLALLSGLGLTTGVLRFIPEYLGIMDFGHLRGIVRRSQQLTVLTGFILAAVGIALILVLRPLSVNVVSLIYGMSLIPIISLTTLQGEMILGMQRVVLARLPNLIVQPALCIAFAIIITEISGPMNSHYVMTAFGVAALVVVAIQVAIIQRIFPYRLSKSLPVYATNKWLRISLPLLLIAGFQYVLLRADVVILGMLRGEEAAGIYNVASQTALLSGFVFGAVNATAGPMIASLYVRGDHFSLQKLVSAATKWMFWPSLVITAIFLLWGKWILSLFGTEFTVAWSPLCILALGHLANASVGTVAYLMSLTGHQKVSALVLGVSSVVNIILNFFLIYLWNLEGAALATMLTMLGSSIWLGLVVKKYLGVNSFIISNE